MHHKPISFHNVGLSFPQKVCFEGFTTQLQCGSRIAIIGQNGSGKCTLITVSHDVHCGILKARKFMFSQENMMIT
jgi:ATPase subunit of ABC transporter with duplicated ATPase domains